MCSAPLWRGTTTVTIGCGPPAAADLLTSGADSAYGFRARRSGSRPEPPETVPSSSSIVASAPPGDAAAADIGNRLVDCRCPAPYSRRYAYEYGEESTPRADLIQAQPQRTSARLVERVQRSVDQVVSRLPDTHDQERAVRLVGQHRAVRHGQKRRSIDDEVACAASSDEQLPSCVPIPAPRSGWAGSLPAASTTRFLASRRSCSTSVSTARPTRTSVRPAPPGRPMVLATVERREVTVDQRTFVPPRGERQARLQAKSTCRRQAAGW